jgi:hypothetical protein
MKKGGLERWLGGRQKGRGDMEAELGAGRLLWKVERPTGRIDRQGK